MAKVLIADDSDLDRELTARALRRAGPEITSVVVEDGEQALRHFLEDPEVSLILLDHRMPRMGAEEFLEAVPKGRLDGVVVILFSSAVSPANINRSLDLGARAYVEKPTDPTDYAVAVKQILGEYL